MIFNLPRNISQKFLLMVLFIFTSNLHAGEFSAYVNTDGDIIFPDEFRTSMVHLGSWFVPTGDASGFHDVYTEKESIEHFRKTGRFPDGATLVKELRVSHAADYSTGTGVNHSTETIKQWFVMIKDANNRFANNPVWGEGWGWALFKPGNKSSNLASNYKTDCLGCHVPAKSRDWIYTEAYPVLKEK